MTRRPRRYWHEMTTKEFSALDVERVIAILPVGSIEQHGPHLPVWVDSCINEGIIRRTLDLVPDDVPVTVLPMLPVGKSVEHLDYPGTLTLSAETLTRLWTEVGESVARAGVRKLVLFNSHGGQPQIVDIVARDLRVRHRMLVVAVSAYRLGRPPGLFPDSELKHGIHGGSVETSAMLYLRPDLVRREELKNFEPVSVALEKQFKHITPSGNIGFGWQIQDLHPEGACGNAADADAERGKQVVEYAAERLAEVLQEVDRLPLSLIRSRP